ncbi:hypothetical protein HU200_028245 [Digitaria exilis]|uniref:NB-ARC domain-containing protein n=1 Tax=Digitaria exilis TaxID=1010633 RepID=A0A835EU20_9POAL|nr:hypothetical protein HU200_028245 [Digitaria exilis]
MFLFLNLQEFARRNGFGAGDGSGNRLQKATEWMCKILPFWPLEHYKRTNELVRKHGVTSVWGIAGLGKSSLVRSEYYGTLFAAPGEFTKYSWVDVPNPFDLVEFARRLFLYFHSDDNQKRKTAAISMVEEGQDPIQGCRKLLGAGKCLIVIDDVRSAEDWDMIRDTFLSYLSNDSSMVVITSKAAVGRRCVNNDESSMIHINGLDADTAFRLFHEVCCLLRNVLSCSSALSYYVYPIICTSEFMIHK